MTALPRSTRAVVKARPEPGGLAFVERALPPLDDHDVLIEIRRSAICGTDLHLFKWNDWARRNYRPPFPLGHEFAGEVTAVGARVETFAIGDRVTAETHLPCGQCRQCRMGRAHTCLKLRLFSRMGLGCFADRTVVPATMLRRVPHGISWESGAVMEPLGVAVRAASEVPVAGAKVLVTGCGAIGLFAIAAARALGAASIVATDPSDYRRALATTCGADAAIEPGALRSASAELSGGDLFDVAIDASGHPAAIGDALAALNPGGSLVLASLPDGEIPIDLTRHVILREITLRGIYGRRLDATWLELERLLASGRLDPMPVLTHALPLERFEEAFALAASGDAGKVSFVPNQ